ncbi:hypothetical protein BDY17DRAFT_130140 [Neohortaea acidophila]|uniref:Uncharacterized protein n=1 Tax=Neohortaea acidophila TaxID=245834 RepID=A0A6A6PWX2_9PEZI|nr:uncharacterized protein BDY17DRAFT_130140 [Neohortaea acidophila]KAF2484515.1 hypothetical protein BDY17DRAFT_130140 [Neohortaea acidophila]
MQSGLLDETLPKVEISWRPARASAAKGFARPRPWPASLTTTFAPRCRSRMGCSWGGICMTCNDVLRPMVQQSHTSSLPGVRGDESSKRYAAMRAGRSHLQGQACLSLIPAGNPYLPCPARPRVRWPPISCCARAAPEPQAGDDSSRGAQCANWEVYLALGTRPAAGLPECLSRFVWAEAWLLPRYIYLSTSILIPPPFLRTPARTTRFVCRQHALDPNHGQAPGEQLGGRVQQQRRSHLFLRPGLGPACHRCRPCCARGHIGAVVVNTNSNHPDSVTSTTPTTASNPPLTTIFTPPARCAHIEYSFSAAQSGTSTFWRDASGPGLGTQSACYPPGFAAVQTSSNLQYSPGVCPSGYLPASSATAPSQSAMTSWCCRSGLKYAQDFGCFTTITTPTVVRLNAESTTTMSTAFVAADWPIQVAWNSADLNLFTPASAPLIEASAAAANNTQANMTGQEIAGLGIGVPAAVAAIAVACYALWRRKRRQPHHAELLDDDPSEMEQTYFTWTPEPKRTDTPHIEVPVPTVQSRRFDVAYRVGEPGPSYSTSYSPPEAALDETEPPAEPR